MATFWEKFEFELTPQNIYDSLSETEEKELLLIFEDKGKAIAFESKRDLGLLDKQWKEIMFKLVKGRHLLAIEEEEAIKKIANRL